MEVSVVIPAREELYLQNTIDAVFTKAKGSIEVIVVLDGYWPNPPLTPQENLIIIHRGKVHGMRSSVNTGVAAAKGKYILKCDGHCSFAEGFDTQLIEDCKEYNWTLVPTRYSLDTSTFDRKINKKYEFQYISSDDLKGKTWHAYGKRVKDEKLIDLMTTQGSFWFMTKKWFEEIGGEDSVNYGHMGREAQEICLKTWLGGGRFVLTRNTWYAHWSKSRRHLKYGNEMTKQKLKSTTFAHDFWINDKWDKAVRPLSWLVEKFAPVPTWDVPKEVIVEEKITPKEYIKSKYKVIPYTNQSIPIGSSRRLTLPKMGRRGLYEMFKALGFKTGAEIGVQKGHNAALMCAIIPDLKLYLIEPYLNQPGFVPKRKRNQKHGSFKRLAYEALKDYNVEWLEGFSEDVFSQVPDGSLDFVYIDGNHAYDFVMLDIILWSRKVKPGGIVCGHDYLYTRRKKPRDIVRAVNDYARMHNLFPIYITDPRAVNTRKGVPGDRYPSWLWVKK